MKWKFILLIVAVSSLSLLTFQNCNKADPCEGVICLNGGTCVDGFCNCAPGYTGDNCELQVKPAKIIVKKFELLGYPASNGGNPWDQFDGPDIYLRIMEGKTEVYRYHKTVLNAVDGPVYTMTPLTEVDLDPDTDYTIEIWDDDSDQGANDQKIQTTTKFKPYSANNNFPDTINVKSFLWDLDMNLYLEYVHN
jgi:hypothetical protein